MIQKTKIMHSAIRTNQRGASAIMFSLFFIMVISLISLSFAVLVRNDQRATLDKTLSSQGQLAAESGINAASEYLKTNGTELEKTDCTTTVDGFTVPQFSNGTQITCVTWDGTPNEAVKDLYPYEGWTFVNSTATNEDVITWQTNGGGWLYGGSEGRRDAMPSVAVNNLPIIKIAALSRSDITTEGKMEIFYLVPAANGADTTVDLGDGGTNNNINGNGAVFNVNCIGAVCKATISGYPSSGVVNRMYYIQLIGDKSATITYQSKNGGNLLELNNIQAKVDVNVLAQDQSKRLISYVSLKSTPTTWQPFFAVLGNSLCKDIKVDGTNSLPAPGSSGTVCPNQ